MSGINFRKAVLLIHDGAGARSITSTGTSLSSQAAHDMNYQGRTKEWEEKGGCERELTQDDRDRLRMRELGQDVSRALDYDARQNDFADKGADRMEDATWWGQDGPWDREALERDMLMCGGASIRSIITVERASAHELGLDTKQAFQVLMRANWQNMMVGAGIAQSPKDVHWYACYHTDAKNSLHIHINTWVAKSPLKEGFTFSAAQTRRMKEMLYRDAYAIPRQAYNLAHNYLRSYLPLKAKIDLGLEVEQRQIDICRRNALRAGIEPPSLKACEITETDRQKLKELQVKLESELNSGQSGNLWSNYRAYSAAFKLVDKLASVSQEFGSAWDQYRGYLENKADMCGLAAPKQADKQYLIEVLGSEIKAERELSAARIVQAERRSFVDKEIKDIKRRIAYPLMRAHSEEYRKEDRIRERVNVIRRALIKDALDRKDPLKLTRERQGFIKQSFQAALGKPEQDRSDSLKADLDKSIQHIIKSPVVEARIDQAAQSLQHDSKDYANVSLPEIKEELSVALHTALYSEVSNRLERGQVRPFGQEAWIEARQHVRFINYGLVRMIERTQGVSVGMNLEEYRAYSMTLNETRALAQQGWDKNSSQISINIDKLATQIIASPQVQRQLDSAHETIRIRLGDVNCPTREKLEEQLKERVGKSLTASIEREIQREARRGQEQEYERTGAQRSYTRDLGVGAITAQVVRQLIQEREVNPYIPQDRDRARRRTHHR